MLGEPVHLFNLFHLNIFSVGPLPGMQEIICELQFLHSNQSISMYDSSDTKIWKIHKSISREKSLTLIRTLTGDDNFMTSSLKSASFKIRESGNLGSMKKSKVSESQIISILNH